MYICLMYVRERVTSMHVLHSNLTRVTYSKLHVNVHECARDREHVHSTTPD